MSVEITRETIGPDQAKALLDRNVHNRNPKESQIKVWARVMRGGGWKFNGEAIKIAEDNTLLDGQNRLRAVIAAQVPIEFLVIRGLPNEVQETMDQGSKRTAGDVLQMAGVTDGNKVAAATRMIARWNDGERSINGFTGSQQQLSNQEVRQLVETDGLIIPAVRAASTVDGLSLMTPRVLATLWYITVKADNEYGPAFMAKVINGEGLHKGHPALTLRRYWTFNRRMGADRPGLMLNAGVRCWNNYAKGRPVISIMWKSEFIPEPVSGVRQLFPEGEDYEAKGAS